MTRYQTDFRYSDRKSKARYIRLKYGELLEGKILDVGSDECALREHLSPGVEYVGIDKAGKPDRVVDLEREKIPFPDASFDCVLCTDVLEHVDNIHQVFDELCRVSRCYVIRSLPNPCGELWRAMLYRDYAPGRLLKFYGLPPEPPDDRHKWFFTPEEAEKFIHYRAGRNGMVPVQVDYDRMYREGRSPRARLRRLARAFLLRSEFPLKNLEAGTLWAVLERRQRLEA